MPPAEAETGPLRLNSKPGPWSRAASGEAAYDISNKRRFNRFAALSV